MKFRKFINLFLLLIVCLLISAMVTKAQDNSKIETRELKSDEVIEREMTGVETHRYKFTLKAGEFFQVQIEQKGVDVALKLFDVDGKELATMDSPNSKEGSETLSFVTEKFGNFILEVSSFEPKVEKGSYTLKREASRIATELDKRRCEVEKIFVEGMKARDTEGQAELSITKLSVALTGWQELKDTYLEDLTKQQIQQLKDAHKANFLELEIGKSVERSLRVEKTDVYTIELKKGSVLKIDVEEKGIDVILSFVKGNNDKFIVRRDAGSGEDRESFTAIIEEDGLFGVFVLAEKSNENGSYSLNSQLNQSETEQDRIRIEAERLIDTNYLNIAQKSEQELFIDFIKNLETSLTLWRKLEDVYWEGFTSYILGNSYTKLNDKTKALEFYNRALQIYEKQKNNEKQFQLLTTIKEIYKEQKDKTKLIETLKKEAIFWNFLNYPLKEALTYSEIAQMYELQYYDDSPKVSLDFFESIKNYEKALTLYQKVEENSMIISVAGVLSSLHNARGNYDEAIKYTNLVLSTEIRIPQGADETHKKDFEDRMNDSKLFAKSTLATAYTQKGDWDKALAYYNEILSVKNVKFDETTDLRYVARISIAQIYFFKYESEKAIKIFQEVLVDERKEKHTYHVANILNIIGTVYLKMDEYENALKYFNESLETLNTLKEKNIFEKKLEDSLYNHIGLANLDLGNMSEAITSFNKSLNLLNETNDPIFIENKSTTYTNLANYYNSIGDFPKAIGYLKTALGLFHNIPSGLKNLARNRSSEALINNSLGTMYNNLGNKEESLKYYIFALDLAIKANDKSVKAGVLKSLGIHWAEMGDMKTARNYIDQALDLFQEIKEQKEVALSLGGIAHIYDYLGEKEKALHYYDLSIDLARKIKSKSIEMQLITNKAATYGDLGENSIALKIFEEASQIAHSIGNKEQEAFIFNNIGAIYGNLKDNKSALKYYQESALIFNHLGNNRLKSSVVANVGLIFFELGDRENALINLKESLRLSRSLDDKKQLSYTLNTIGRVYSNLEEKEIAFKSFGEALLITKLLENNTQESNILRRLMTFYKKIGNKRMAIFLGKLSVNNQQNLRQKVRGLDVETQKSFLKKNVERYQELAELLLDENQNDQSIQVLNLFKDQQVYDSSEEINKNSKKVLFTLRENEFSLLYASRSATVGEINGRLEALKRSFGTRQPTAEETAQLQKVESELKNATDSFLAVLKQAETEFSTPPDEKDRIGNVPDTSEMQNTLRNLNQQTGQKAVAVYTLVGEDNFRALIVSPDGIKAVSSPIKGTELNGKALKLWGLLQSDKYDTTVLSKQIYDVVFKPIEAELPKDTTTIMWSLDGNLRYLPMGALWDGKQFLAEGFNHVIFTRADPERMTRNLNPNWTGSGFGTSQPKTVELLGSKISFSGLPGVKAELAEIFKQTDSKIGLLIGDVQLDANFTQANFLEAMKQKRPVVHIASHFSFRPGDEARSFLLMGDGTAFTLNDMKKKSNLFDGVDLLTLSACNTAATQSDANGREIDGFAELAQRLGASAVMATLWSVADESTALFMSEFYANKQGKDGKSGMTKAAAIQQAQKAMITGKIKSSGKGSGCRSEPVGAGGNASDFKCNPNAPFSHPFYWSPFILIGNWK